MTRHIVYALRALIPALLCFVAFCLITDPAVQPYRIGPEVNMYTLPFGAAAVVFGLAHMMQLLDDFWIEQANQY